MVGVNKGFSAGLDEIVGFSNGDGDPGNKFTGISLGTRSAVSIVPGITIYFVGEIMSSTVAAFDQKFVFYPTRS